MPLRRLALVALASSALLVSACSASAGSDPAASAEVPDTDAARALVSILAGRTVVVHDTHGVAWAGFDSPGPMREAIDSLTQQAASVSWDDPAACSSSSCERVGQVSLDSGASAQVVVQLVSAATTGKELSDPLLGPGHFTVAVKPSS